MVRIKSIPSILSAGNILRKYNHYGKPIEAARAAGDVEKEKKEIAEFAGNWARDMAKKFGMELEVRNPEKIPVHDGLVFIANHQGYCDIPALIIACNGRQIGFIAKDSLKKVPMLGKWIEHLHGLFLKRGDAREALRSLQEGAKMLKQGYNLVIFPEGTRSQGPEMARFKAGSFKLATMAKATIVPVSISGSYHIYEENGKASPGKVTVLFHNPVETRGVPRKELREMEEKIEETIRQGLLEITGSENV